MTTHTFHRFPKAHLFFLGSLLATSLLFAQEKVVLRIGYPSAGALINGQVGTILSNTDILKKNGLDAEVTPFLYGPPMQEALMAGHIDAALTSEANFVNLASKFPCQLVGTLGVAGRIGLLVKTDSTITSVADLKGKTVTTIFGTSAHYPLIQWITAAKLEPDQDVKVIHMAAAEARMALIKGDVDAITMWDPFVEDFVQKKAARVIASKPSFWTTVVFSDDFVQKNPETVVQFLVALKEALFYMNQNKEAVNTWLSQTMQVSPAVIDGGAKFNFNYADAKKFEEIRIVPDQDLIDTLTAIADFNFNQKLIKNKPAIREKINFQPAEQADKKSRDARFDPTTVRIENVK